MAAIAVALLLLVVLGGLCLLIWWLIRRQKRDPHGQHQAVRSYVASMDRVGERVMGGSDGRTFMERWTIQRGARTFSARFEHPGKTPARFFVTGELEAMPQEEGTPFRSSGVRALDRLPRLRLRAERGIDRFGKGLRLNREVQTGDPRFDERVYIESDASDEDVTALLGSPMLRAAVVALLDLGCTDVVLNVDNHHLAIRWLDTRGRNPFDGDQIERVLAELDAFVAELPRFASVDPPSAWPRGSGFVAAALSSVFVGFLLNMIAFNLWQPLTRGPFDVFFGVGLGLYLALVVTCWWRVRGTSNALRHLGWTAALGLAGVPLLLAGVVLTANGLFDTTVRDQRVEIEDRYTTSGKSTSYRIVVAPWPPHHEPFDIRVGSDDYHALSRGEATLRIGSGALGIAWYDGVAGDD